MRDSLLFSGIPEQSDANEDLIREKILTIFTDKLDLADGNNIKFTRCHRMYSPKKPGNNRPRDIIVKFHYYPDRMKVFHAAKKLKDSGIFINEFFPREIDRCRRILRPVLNYLKQHNVKAVLSQDKLVCEGQAYTVDNIHSLPYDISSVGTKFSSKYVLFHGRLSVFSNFYVGESGFTIDDTPYRCVEQFYQKSKAVFSGDLDTAAEIMMESDPAQMKQLGDKIKLNGGQWKRFKSLDVMEKAVWEKFHQNPTLMKQADQEAATCGV